MTTATFYDRVRAELADIDAQGLTKPERIIASRQGPVIKVGGRDVLNFCANNYLGLAGDERVAQAGIKAQEQWGAGTASVRCRWTRARRLDVTPVYSVPFRLDPRM